MLPGVPEIVQGLGINFSPIIDNIGDRIVIDATMSDTSVKVSLQLKGLNEVLAFVLKDKNGGGSEAGENDDS